MADAPELSVRQSLRENIAALPHKAPVEYGRNQIIYEGPHPATGLCLVIKGRVKVATKLEDGSEVVKGIFGAEELFAESGLLGNHADSNERATTLDRTAIVSWTDAEVETRIQCHPGLGMFLVRMVAARCLEFAARLESFAVEKTPARVARVLLQFARTAGQSQPDGGIRIAPLTQQVIAGYVGTSREIVTLHMTAWRQQGLLRYSRTGIEIKVDALSQALQVQPFSGEQEEHFTTAQER